MTNPLPDTRPLFATFSLDSAEVDLLIAAVEYVDSHATYNTAAYRTLQARLQNVKQNAFGKRSVKTGDEHPI